MSQTVCSIRTAFPDKMLKLNLCCVLILAVYLQKGECQTGSGGGNNWMQYASAFMNTPINSGANMPTSGTNQGANPTFATEIQKMVREMTQAFGGGRGARTGGGSQMQGMWGMGGSGEAPEGGSFGGMGGGNMAGMMGNMMGGSGGGMENMMGGSGGGMGSFMGGMGSMMGGSGGGMGSFMGNMGNMGDMAGGFM